MDPNLFEEVQKMFSRAHALDLMVCAFKNLTLWAKILWGPCATLPLQTFAHRVRFWATESSPIGTPPHERSWTLTLLQGGREFFNRKEPV